MVPAEHESRDLPDLSDIDRLIHEPARLLVMALLSVVESADFLFLLRQTGLTQGNLSSHLSKLEEAGYVEIAKTFQGKRPRTTLRISPAGRVAFEVYRGQLDRLLAEPSRVTDNDNAI
jgi:DNA-binding transcriptional ArsR family regulator